MSDDKPFPISGPPMVVATKALKPGRAVVGQLTSAVTLPRAVPVVTLAASAIGVIVMVTMSWLLFGRNLQVVFSAAILGAAAGWFVTTYSPLKGESMARWIGLELASRRGRIRYDGRLARVYVGIYPVQRLAAGPTRIRPGAVDVQEGFVDDRGWLLPPRLRTITPTTPRITPPTAAQPAIRRLEPRPDPDRSRR